MLYSLLASLSFAENPGTYRKFELSSGRTISGAVLSTTDNGFLVRDKTGVLLVSYESLVNMVNITESEFQATKNPIVLLYTDRYISDRTIHPINQAKTATKGITWKENSELPFPEKDLQKCNLQTMCISNLLAENNITTMVYMHQEDDILQAYSFYSDVSLSNQSKQLSIDPKYPDFTEIYALIIETLGYNTPTKPSLPLMLPPETSAVTWTNWIPLAGLPSMTARNPVGVGKSLAIAVPASLFLVYMSGRSSSTKGQFFFTGFAAYSTASIGANLIVAESENTQPEEK